MPTRSNAARGRVIAAFALALAAAGTAATPALAQSTVGGCTCQTSGSCDDVSFSNIPSDDQYVMTTFGGGSDTQPMACGGSADGTWAYVADQARFGCGAKLSVTANGKTCIAEVADCGPNQCVEQAAANSGCTTNQPVLDSSPLIAQYLYGTDSAGWSDGLIVTVTAAPSDSVIGCPAGTGGSGDAGAPEDAGEGSEDAGGAGCTLPSGESGECLDTSTCSAMGGVATPGYCPGAADVECCTGIGAAADAGSGGSSTSEDNDAGDDNAGDNDAGESGGTSEPTGGTSASSDTNPGTSTTAASSETTGETSSDTSALSSSVGEGLPGAPGEGAASTGSVRGGASVGVSLLGPGSSGGCAVSEREPRGLAGYVMLSLLALVVGARRRSRAGA